MIEPDKCRPPSFGTFHGERPGILFAYLNPIERPCPYNSQNCYQSAGPLAATLLRAWPALNSSRTPFHIVVRERTMSNPWCNDIYISWSNHVPKHLRFMFFNLQPLCAQVKFGLNLSLSLSLLRYLKTTRHITNQLITSVQIQNFICSNVFVFFMSYISNVYKLIYCRIYLHRQISSEKW